MKVIIPGNQERYLAEAVNRFRKARLPVALTGAGISVESGIPDFRSPGGLWTRFSPNEYATLDIFQREPEKAWQLYRDLGRILEGKKPNRAHEVLAVLEQEGLLHGIVTQNVDMLHQQAGSKNVIEIHGDHMRLQCLRCGELVQAEEVHFLSDKIPVCAHCAIPLKPNVVLFGEPVRRIDDIHALLTHCDLLLVVGTSARVYPTAGLPAIVKNNGGVIYEFNLEETTLSRGQSFDFVQSDFLFKGSAGTCLDRLAGEILSST